MTGGDAGTGNINADPLFVNAPNDLHLMPGSPCLGAGTPNGAPPTDADGHPRPNPPSIGAYEGPGMPPPPQRFDFNGDGHPDILRENTSTGQLLVWLMGGPNGTVVQQFGGR